MLSLLEGHPGLAADIHWTFLGQIEQGRRNLRLPAAVGGCGAIYTSVDL